MRSLPSILHVDLDAFYASVEQLHKPSLRGKPVVVGGIGNRGVVSTASYEARAFGVHSALATGIARRRAPNAAYLIPRFGAYQVYSERVMALMHELSPLVEPLSLDEAFIDISHLMEPIDRQSSRNATLKARQVADDLRTRIKDETGLTASIGAGSSKLIAKIASDAEKPDGLVIIEPGTEQTWLDPLPVRALWGVGPATAERLRKIGATTVAELRTLSHAELTAAVGASYGATLYAIARGQDDRDVSTDRELKSVSVEDTFAEDLLDPATITSHMDDLVTRLGSRIRKAGRSGRTITIKVRGHDFTTVSRSETTPNPTDDPAAIRAATHRMLPGAVAAATQLTPGVRLLGVGLTGLAEWAQLDLFSTEEDDDTLDFWDRDAETGPGDSDEDFDMPRGVVEGPVAPAAPAAPTAPAAPDPDPQPTQDPAPQPDPADITTPVPTVEGERSPRQFGPLPPGTRGAVETAQGERRFLPGQDVAHDEFGGGWVQGSGLGRVTVRFERPWTGSGRIKTLRSDDPALRLADAADVAREALELLAGRGPDDGISIGDMTDEPTKTEVVDNELEDRFEIWHGDRLAGFAAYRRRDDATVFVHTQIEPEFEGKGLASVLARRALDETVARGQAIIPVCPFIAAYLRKHPEYEEHVRWPAADSPAGDRSGEH
ncbi:DNA polymerase IV [Catenulispora sp. NL8]|uniref:DNA polymerase IV n=1 Tax=Catenulispora pinistramenti TaxID=2705254 RepID=A0ABS5KKA5_9ACTN|nr:DNA polymerase IV [Catenulispora pinistramenti]MBS2545841.1 DNA polymerase IV [Catenulispora pinistramenti]